MIICYEALNEWSKVNRLPNGYDPNRHDQIVGHIKSSDIKLSIKLPNQCTLCLQLTFIGYSGILQNVRGHLSLLNISEYRND